VYSAEKVLLGTDRRNCEWDSDGKCSAVFFLSAIMFHYKGPANGCIDTYRNTGINIMISSDFEMKFLLSRPLLKILNSQMT